MTTDVSEKKLEEILVEGLCAHGWKAGNRARYLPQFAIDLEQLTGFLADTQPAVLDAIDLVSDGPPRHKLLQRIANEITERGIVDVLRNGVKVVPHGTVNLFYGTPSRGNAEAARLNALNRFTVVRQLHYGPIATALSVDVVLFINGLPVATLELKNNLTKQNVKDAITQYQQDRDPRELLFKPKRCLAHFAVDDQQVAFCADLRGADSWFLPFDKGHNNGAGNPPNPHGLKTAYLWEEQLATSSFTNILENYAQVIVEERTDRNTKRKTKRQRPIWPRYHQLDVVRELLKDVAASGAGRRYLIQHSAGSGKSNSIAWLTHQLAGLEHTLPDSSRAPVFDTVIVVTDRRVLDKQIDATIRQFAQVRSTVGHARTSAELRTLIAEGKKIVITTIQKFPFIVAAVGDEHRDRSFAIVIDEAHSSQTGRTATALARAIRAKQPIDADADIEPARGIDDEDTGGDDPVEDLIVEAMKSRKMAQNASYFAFTATPKNKTLEMFGDPYVENGVTRHRPFHTYTMKQAIQEGFILDVLQAYTPVSSYYKLVKTVEDDPEFDSKRAQKQLRAYVEGHQHAVATKAGIIVDHFLGQVIAPRKIGGQARAMVVCGSIRRAIDYYHAISKELGRRGGKYKAIVAFSGEHTYGGVKVTEASLNGFPSKDIEDRIVTDPYRILVCADKFQTGYDEPLLHTMYVDKVLSGVKAVQTLSRLNRAQPGKHDVFVLDFQNEASDIQKAFADFYRTTLLSEETDANKLHDLKRRLDDSGVYDQTDVDGVVIAFLAGADRQQLDPILDVCAQRYVDDLDEDGQVRVKGDAKAFVRTYDFLGSILAYSVPEWEELSIFLNLLVDKLPTPEGDDLSRGMLEVIDMDSYRAEKQATAAIALPDADAEIDPIPIGGPGRAVDPELERLSAIIASFNDLFGNIGWSDKDRIARIIAEELPAKVNADEKYQNAKRNSGKENARIEHDLALQRVILGMMRDDTELFTQFMQNKTFQSWLAAKLFEATYENPAA